MIAGSLALLVLGTALAAGEVDDPPARIFESPTEAVPQGKIDQLVFARLRQLGIPPARPCSDAVFLRRAYLDVTGTLPSIEEARRFLLDQSPAKRRDLVERLLGRPEFADYWAMKWCDLLRVKAEFPINLWPHAAQGYHRWIRASLQENHPYDQFARELLTANGSNFLAPPVNFYRALQSKDPHSIARAVALTFLGARAENWPPERLAGLAGFFAQLNYKPTAEWKEEIVFHDPHKTDAATQALVAAAAFPDGTPARLSPGRDPRAVFADWLVSPQNPWFARAAVNRVWFWLLGRGIIHEPDDIRPDNAASNPELLAYLEQELVAAHYDLKHIYRLILNSTTYQLSSIARSPQPEAGAGANFARYPVRRLEAEVLIDALCQVTGTTERYTSEIPEPFTYIPEGARSIGLPDGSITSSFLAQFGRPTRDTGLETDRNNQLTSDQRLHLLNSSHIRLKIEQSPVLKSLLPPESKEPDSKKASAAQNRGKSDPQTRQQLEAEAAAAWNEIITAYYLLMLSRFPTADELRLVAEHSPPRRGPIRAGPNDLAWALINSAEFLYRH